MLCGIYRNLTHRSDAAQHSFCAATGGLLYGCWPASLPAAQTAPPTASQSATAAAGQSAQSAQPAATAELPDAPGVAAAARTEPVPTGPTIVIDTTMGRLTCKTFDKQAPKAVANFIGLAEGTKDWTVNATHAKQHGKRFYDGLTFHRVIPGFIVTRGATRWATARAIPATCSTTR